MSDPITIGEEQAGFYHEHGYLVLPGVVDAGLLARLREQTDAVCARAASVTANDAVYDLEDSHRPDHPRVRRIKQPHTLMSAVEELVRLPAVGAAVARLFGTGVRLKGTKMNIKAAAYGAPVEWHQDWAFYPHTNDDVLAMGVLLDDSTEENGPLLVLPGSHRGPIHDHHAEGYFCGAMDPAACALDFASAVALTGPAGSLTFHHVRAVHGSALNRSSRPRRLLLAEYTAVDAWPLVNLPADLGAYDAEIIHGESTLTPRLVPVPVRLPLPPARHAGSIYENQRTRAQRYFGEHVKAAADAAE